MELWKKSVMLLASAAMVISHGNSPFTFMAYLVWLA